MAKYRQFKQLSLPNVDKEVAEKWAAENIFEKSITSKKDGKSYVFYEGPPSANGMPGIHHVMGRTVKDIFCRFKTMKGFQVNRKAGWDTHGLPIELGVEKELGITKEDIGTKISVEEYNAACKKAVMRYTDVWNNVTQKMGYWVDMENPYITYDSKYMESIWWLLKQIYDKGLMYKGYTIQPYSPKAGTGLSSHELNQPGTYQDVTDTTVVAQFKVIEENLPAFLTKFDHLHLLAWTTTPWTLPSNTALTVGKKIDYVVVATYNQYTFEPIHVVLAKNLVGKQFTGKYEQTEEVSVLENYSKEDKKIPFFIAAECKGADLIDIKYEQLLPYALPHDNPENAFRVIHGDFVTTEDGTGIVHTAPTFGADDAKVAKEATPEIPALLVKDDNDKLVPLVDLQGKFRPEMGEFGGKYVKNEYYNAGEAPDKSIDVEISIKLKTENKAFKVEKYKHSYPHCWRTDKPILYYPLDSWFIKVTDVRDRMFDLNETINWKPKATGEGRFGNWLKNANDWNLSRSRFWGTPLPIWRTEDGKEEIIIGSLAELKAEMQKSLDAGILKEDIFADFEAGNMTEENYNKVDLHKSIVDQIVLVSKTGQPMLREADLIDVWFDSGAMPYAQWHYPFENKDLIDKETAYPADFIAEGVDQTRGWFYTLHAIGTMVFDSVAYKNVVSNGLVLDKNGQKMSKRLGNGVDPFETIDNYGADAARWYMVSNASPWDNLKFDTEGIKEVQRKFFGTLHNTYAFFALYANVDEFDAKDAPIPLAERPEIDRWVLSVLNSLVKDVNDSYNDYEPTKAARAIQYFLDEQLSNWYVRLCRRRFWKGDYSTDKKAAYQTLFTCLETIYKLIAPISPFYSDLMYCTLNTDAESVHLEDFPTSNEAEIDKELEERMSYAQRITSMVLALRKRAKLRVRQPLSKILLPILDENFQHQVELVKGLILSELNIKELEYLHDTAGILVKKVKPNFRLLGRKLGKRMQEANKLISAFTQEQIAELESNGKYMLFNDKPVEITLEEVEVLSEDIPGWLVNSENGLTVALDVTLTEELENEGMARELVNRIQKIRKDNDFELTDRIKVIVETQEKVSKAVSSFGEYISNEILADALTEQVDLNQGEKVELTDDISIHLLVEKN